MNCLDCTSTKETSNREMLDSLSQKEFQNRLCKLIQKDLHATIAAEVSKQTKKMMASLLETKLDSIETAIVVNAFDKIESRLKQCIDQIELQLKGLVVNEKEIVLKQETKDDVKQDSK